jgi:hypothetical protein
VGAIERITTVGTVIDIMKAIRRLLIDHLATDEPLVTDASPGDTIITLLRTSRFRAGDQVFLKSDSLGLVEKAVVSEVLEWDETLGYQLVLETPLVGTWAVADGSSLLKAINHDPLKRIFLGDLKQIPDHPVIYISLPDETNEWFTLRSTNHEYTFRIRAYILGDNHEDSVEKIAKFGENIREILLDHIHPVVDDPPIILPITADVFVGSTVIRVTDTSEILAGDRIYLRDGELRPAGSQEAVVRTILSPFEIRLATPSEWDFLVSRTAELIVAQRYLYDTRPSSVSYGHVPGQGGSFSHAAEISYFAKEALVRTGNIIT